MNRKDLKKQNIFQLVVITVSIFIAIYIASVLSFRVDLTQEKRYTLSKVSKEIMKSLSDPVLVKVYLEGDMPAGFLRLNRAVHEMLDELKVYAGKNIQYQFVDIYKNNDTKAIGEIIKDLDNKGLHPTRIELKTKEGNSQKTVIPGALISYNGVEIPVNLLSNNPGLSGEENLNNSIQALEYNIVSTIKDITITKLEKIAFLEGHGELKDYEVDDITRSLANFYQVDRGQINGDVHALDSYKCVIIAKPQKAFSEEDKFVLDQYVMNGGKLLWFIDEVYINEDSLVNGNTFAFNTQLNIDDQLFKYGIRINPVLVEDEQSGVIPVSSTSESKYMLAPWLYYPLLAGSQINPVSRNINLVKAEYCSYLDTLEANGKLKKTILLRTSQYTRTKQVPAMISLSEVKQTTDASYFNKSNLPVAAIIEGNFPSVFKNRMLSNLKITGNYSYKDESKNTRMLVVADGNVIRNDIKATPQGIKVSRLGYDRFLKQTFGNKDFILNAVNYLTDDIGLMTLRSKQVILRLLDKTKIEDEKTKWQIINVIMPIVIIVLMGVGINFRRRKKYGTKAAL
jgi:ABC-2 type transport system permease protein